MNQKSFLIILLTSRVGQAEAEESLSIADMEELLGLPVVGVIPGTFDQF